MTLLKLKAKIYHYTGIYLAYREQCDYMESADYLKYLTAPNGTDSEEFSIETKASLAVGLWQARHGFHKPLYLKAFCKVGFHWQIIRFVVEFYMALNYDLKTLYRRIVK